MHIPDLQTLRLFLTVYDRRNLTRAAERHNISTSAVTKRIQELELNYRVTLFERRSRGMYPTPAADVLAHQTRELFARVDQIEATMSEFAQGVRGFVRIGASISVILEHLAGHLVSFNKQHPFVRLDIKEDASTAIIRDVMDGRVDIGLVTGPPEIPPELCTATHKVDRLVAITPKGHPIASRDDISFEELLEFEHVGFSLKTALSRQLNDEAMRLNRTIRHSYQVKSADVVRRFVAEGLGIAIMPHSMTEPYIKALDIMTVPLSDPWARREMQVCHRSRCSLTVAARLFLSHIEGGNDGLVAD